MNKDKLSADRKGHEALIHRRAELVTELERLATRKSALTTVLKLTERRIEAVSERTAEEE